MSATQPSASRRRFHTNSQDHQLRVAISLLKLVVNQSLPLSTVFSNEWRDFSTALNPKLKWDGMDALFEKELNDLVSKMKQAVGLVMFTLLSA